MIKNVFIFKLMQIYVIYKGEKIWSLKGGEVKKK